LEEEGKVRNVKQIHVAYRESRPLTVADSVNGGREPEQM